MTSIKHNYAAKKETLVTKLDLHQAKVEDLLQIYYDTLDNIRYEILDQEYSLRKQMDNFERDTKKLV